MREDAMMNVERMRRYVERDHERREIRRHVEWFDSLPENHTAKRVNRAMAQIVAAVNMPRQT